MEEIYKGYKIQLEYVLKPDTGARYHYKVTRESDNFLCFSSWCMPHNWTEETLMQDLKDELDDSLKNPDPWDEYEEPDEYEEWDEYPTKEQLDKIRNWKTYTREETVKFIEYVTSLWTYSNAIKQTENRLVLHTFGWSGNEDIIAAMRENRSFWSRHWYSTRVGGHYVFKFK